MTSSLRKISALAVAIALAVTLSAGVMAAPSGFENFTYSDNYTDGQFLDVGADDWFTPYVRDAVNFGFMRGRSINSFDPGGLLTLGETVALASRLSSIYRTGSADFEVTVPFYTPYVEYALANGIIRAHGNFSAVVTRFDFAAIMRNALPDEAFAQINSIPEFGIIDVPSDTEAGRAVYALYRAGILTGFDRFGSFQGAGVLTRAEASAIIVRMADPAARVTLTLPTEIPVEELFVRSTNAIFMIETFDENNRSIRTGSGFFINEDGLAVTALHVVDGSASANIKLYNGSTYKVLGIHAYNHEFNLAVIEIDSGKSVRNYLTLADSDMIEVGNTVFAIGSPRSLINSISEGIIAHVGREFNEDTMIQFTAPISFGSGGGPILNTLGQVVGVASSSFTYGQNLNLAIPINLVKELI